MQTIQQAYNPAYTRFDLKKSLLTRFILWCKTQQQYRLGWLAAIVALHGCFLTPVTCLAITLSGNNMIFWTMALAAMGMSLVTNLAALPTKITIPVFFLSILIDAVIIANCFAAVISV